MTQNHDPLLSADVLAAFGDVLAPTGQASTASRIAALAKRSADEAGTEAMLEARYADGLAEEEGSADERPDGQLLTPDALRSYVCDGDGALTLVSRRTGERFVFALALPKNAEATDSRVFVKVRGERTVYLGTVWMAASTWHGRSYPPRFKRQDRSRVPADAPAARAAAWLFDRVARGTDESLVSLLAQADIFGERV
jgi:hypothetical protein